MIAKLFDRISIQSLVYSCAVSLLVLVSAYWLPKNGLTFLFFHDTVSLTAYWAWSVALICTFIAALVFNEVLNRQRMFYGNYHLLVIFCIMALCVFAGNQHIKANLGLPVMLVFFLKVYQLIFQTDGKYHYFEIGLLSGLFSFWLPDYLTLLPISWIAGLVLGKLNVRSIVSSLLGAVASVYMVVALAGFLKLNLWKAWTSNLSGLDLSLAYNLENQWAFIPLGAIFVLILFQLPQLNSRGNNIQRQAVALWYVLLVLSLSGFLFLANKSFYLGLLLFPFGRLAALFVSSNTNFWLRNSLYLFLFASLALVILSGSGFLIGQE